MLGRGLAFFLSVLLLADYSACATAETRQERQARYDWRNMPGQKMFFDSRSPMTVSELLSRGGEPVKLEAHLWMPEKASGPVPAVVIFSCGAVVVKEKAGVYGDEFHRQGYAVVNLNSLKSRVDDVAHHENAIWRYRYATIVDVFEVLKTLAADPRIDPKRIAIIGWVNGGMPILSAPIEELREIYIGSDIRYAAMVAISPYCSIATLGARYSATPILTLHGEKDDFMPLKPCELYRKEAVARGANIEMFVYPGIYHNWDMVGLRFRFDSASFGFKEDCLMQTDLKEGGLRLGDGTMLRDDTRKRGEIISKYTRSCRTGGITQSGDQRTRTDAIARVMAFIKKALVIAS